MKESEITEKFIKMMKDWFGKNGYSLFTNNDDLIEVVGLCNLSEVLEKQIKEIGLNWYEDNYLQKFVYSDCEDDYNGNYIEIEFSAIEPNERDKDNITNASIAAAKLYFPEAWFEPVFKKGGFILKLKYDE